MLERVRVIDCLSFWAEGALMKHRTHLRCLQRFLSWRSLWGSAFATFTALPALPSSAAVSLQQWAELRRSLRTKKGTDGEAHWIGFNALRQIKSGASLCCVPDTQNAFPHQVLRDRVKEEV